MKITVIKQRPTKLIRVVKADYLNDFVLRVFFDDGTDQVVDFKHFLIKSSHPDLKKYSSEKKFKGFKISEGNLNWNDYEMIFPLESLYNGKI